MKKTLKLIVAALTLLVLVLSIVSCSSSMGGSAPSYPSYDGGDKYENGMAGAPGDIGSGITGSTEVLDPNRKIIKTVRESIQTEAFDDLLREVRESVAELGGYISSANQSGDSYYNSESRRNASLTVRIPAEKLDEFTKKVDSLAVVTSYSESMDDVTGAYVDVESRISVLAAEETALLAMLAESNNVSTALEIRKRLNDVQSDLASLRAQKNTYDSLIAYSTVYMSIYEVRRAEVANPSFFEEVGGVFNDSLYDIGEGLRSFAVWFLGNIIYIVIFAGIVTGAIFLYNNIRKKRKAKKEAKKDTPEENK